MEDIQNDVTKFIQRRSGNPNLALADPASVGIAMGLLLGVVDSTSITYQFLRNGSVLPQGSPQRHSFALREYEGYVGDSYRMRHDLTLTFGVRYTNSGPPCETRGLQVAPNEASTSCSPKETFCNRRASPAMPWQRADHPVRSIRLSGPRHHAWKSTSYNFTTAPASTAPPRLSLQPRPVDSHIPRPTSPRLSARPWVDHRIQFRAEAFNTFNNVNFIKPSLALHAPATFGEFTDTMASRVMQFALRYEF